MTNTLTNSDLTLQVSSHGAELCSIRSTATGHEYLWQADPAYWKRHSPVLFPIVGSVWENEYRYAGHTYQLTQHGFARDLPFEQLEASPNHLLYRLTDTEETRRRYPFPFLLQIAYRLDGRRIEVQWHVTNTGTSTMHFQIGAHPAFYFPAHDPATSQRGYFGFDRTQGLYYKLVAEKGCVDPVTRHPLPLADDGLLPLDVHTFDHDALILEDAQVHKVVLYDNHRQPWLALHFEAPVVGLWSPPSKDAPFVCIEPWYGRCDRAHYTGEFQDKDWMQHLAPQATFCGGYTIEILAQQ